jgi:uncharacterized protein (TIGR02117 family)
MGGLAQRGQLKTGKSQARLRRQSCHDVATARAFYEPSRVMHSPLDALIIRMPRLFPRLRAATLALLVITLITGCASPPPARRALPPTATTKPLWLISNGFHTAVALRTEDAGPTLRGLAPDPDAKWMLIGWGQADFFLARRYSLLLFLKGAFIPGPSAMHLMPMRSPPQRTLAHSDVVRLAIPSEKLKDVRVFIESALARDAAGKPISLGPGYHARSVFYAGRERFVFPHTCNSWCARALREAGVNIPPENALVANDLTRQAAQRGSLVGVKRKPVDGF